MNPRVLPTVILSAVLSGCPGGPAIAAPQAVAPLPPVVHEGSFPFYLSATRMMVMVRVGGGLPAPMVFDTGTNGNLIAAPLADALHLPHTGPSDSIDGSTGQPVAGYKTLLTNATVGGFAMADGPATVADYKAEDEAGVIGPNSFPGRLVMLDFKAKRIRVFTTASKRAPVGAGTPYRDALPSVKVTIEGTVIDAKLDTGNDSALLLPTSLLKRLRMKAPPEVIGYATSAAGQQPVLEGQVDGDVQIGEVHLASPRVRFMDGGTPNVGLPIIQQMQITLDPDHGLSWIESTPADPGQPHHSQM